MLELRPAKIVWFEHLIKKSAYTFRCKSCKNIESLHEKKITWFKEKGLSLPKTCKSCKDRQKRELPDFQKPLPDVVKSLITLEDKPNQYLDEHFIHSSLLKELPKSKKEKSDKLQKWMKPASLELNKEFRQRVG